MKTISPKRLEKIARNINAMDMFYQYSDDHRVWSFWNNLHAKLIEILKSLSSADKYQLKGLCEEKNAKYFGLI